MRKSIIYGCAVATVALLAGCGSSNSNSSSSAGSSTPSSTSAGSAGVTIASKQGRLGTILAAGPKQLTVYMFGGDRGPTPTCSGTCASVWPPVSSAAGVAAGGQALAADLGTARRSDGTRQVTYKGHPLYYYTRDAVSGDAYGQGINSFGAGWSVLTPAGTKPESGESESSSGSGGSAYKY